MKTVMNKCVLQKNNNKNREKHMQGVARSVVSRKPSQFHLTTHYNLQVKQKTEVLEDDTSKRLQKE